MNTLTRVLLFFLNLYMAGFMVGQILGQYAEIGSPALYGSDTIFALFFIGIALFFGLGYGTTSSNCIHKDATQ